MQKLTETQLKAIKPRKTPFKVSDGRGLFLLVTEVGKYWRWKYRFDGKEKSLSFGKYPEISLAKAREVHQAGRASLKEGQPADSPRIRAAELLGKHHRIFEEKEAREPPDRTSEELADEINQLLKSAGSP
ncbi:MAG: Arm DNA-binding domain-containing protein [Candidatus Azotimanducaceae bacterium]